MSKTKIFIIFLNLFVFSLVAYTLIYISNPFEKKNAKIDNLKIQQIQILSSRTNEFFSKYGKLPNDINMVLDPSEIKIDPKNPITYNIKSDTVYEFCTNFLTDTNNESTNSMYYALYGYNSKTKHGKGQDCLSFAVEGYYLTEGLKFRQSITPN